MRVSNVTKIRPERVLNGLSQPHQGDHVKNLSDIVAYVVRRSVETKGSGTVQWNVQKLQNAVLDGQNKKIRILVNF